LSAASKKAALDDSQRPVLEGTLDKYASAFPFNWKTRHFELGFDGVLRYYTAE
jgi:hypothetical protein